MAVTTNLILKKDKKNLKGEHPILLTVSVAGIRRKLSTGIYVLPELWNEGKKEVEHLSRKEAKKKLPNHDYDLLPLADDVKRMNRELAAMAARVEGIVTKHDIDGIPYDVDTVVEEFKTSKQGGAKKVKIKLYLSDYMDKRIPLLAKQRSKGTLQVYRSTLEHFRDFEAHTKTRYQLKDITYGVFEELAAFLLEPYGREDGVREPLQNSTIHKVVKTLKTFLNHAKLKEGIETSANYHAFNIELKSTEPVTLTGEELDTLFNLELPSMLGRVRDVFVFACTTGLRMSDIRQLRREHLQGDVIRITTEKTDDEVTIPLNHYSGAVLHKYRLQIRPLPRLSEQHLNTEIKNLCKLAGIDTPTPVHSYHGAFRETRFVPKYQTISMHTARRTFVSLALEKGLDVETIRRWTGHRDLRSFSAYVSIGEKRKKEAMAKVFGEPTPSMAVGGGE